MKIEIPYGAETQTVEISDKNSVEIVQPNKIVSTEAENVLLSNALNNPVESKSLEDFLADVNNLLIIVNDAQRPTPTARVLDVIKKYIEKHNFGFLIATGSHREPTEEELKFIFGRHLDKFRDRIYTHRCTDESEMIHFGETGRGTPVKYHRLLAEADAVLTITSVEPHYFAGYTGGRKSLIPGIAAYETISKNHKLVMEPAAANLKLEGNPVHEDMMEAFDLVKDKNYFSIQLVLDRHHRIYKAFCGDIKTALTYAARSADEIFSVKIKERADVVVTVPYPPLDASLYQSQKAIEHAKAAVKEGGIIILASFCKDGLGPSTFYELLSPHSSPEEFMEKAKTNYRLGQHKALKLVETFNIADLWAVTGLDKSILENIFIKPFKSIQSAVDQAISLKGSDCSFIFLLNGGMTVPKLS